MPRPIDLLRDKLFPGSTENIENGKCATCGKPIIGFRDELSLKEFKISGMCQECQDGVFENE